MWHAMSALHDKSCTVTNCHVANMMPHHRFGGVGDLFQTIFFCRDVFQKKFFGGTKTKTDLNYRDENHI